jgi:hypothetical protein
MLLKKSNILFAIAVLSILGCSKVMMNAYGIRTPRSLDKNSIIKYANEAKLPLIDCYEIDSTYAKFLSSFDTARFKAQMKNHFQPLQALYYDRSGQLVSFQINCYAGGFPNFAWDRDSIMSTFPPRHQAPLDSFLSLEMQLKYLHPLSNTARNSVKDYDYIIFVYWNHFMSRQSKRLINFVQTNAKLAPHNKVAIVYVNNDNLYHFNESL